MAETICRTLRDGTVEGEHAPALTIKDSIASPFGCEVFSHLLSQLSSFIAAEKSQARGIVVVALSQSPLYYVNLLRKRGVDVTSSHKWIRILDCYSDPLGWKDLLTKSGKVMDISDKASSMICPCKNVKDLEKLCSLILELGIGLVGQRKIRFSVAIDSISEMLRHASKSTVARFLSNLRSHEQVSSIFWLLHADLHEARVTSALEYISSMVASVEPLSANVNGQRVDLDFSLPEYSFGKAKFNVSLKRRNGRIRTMSEIFENDPSGVKFATVTSEDGIINQGLLPKVHFNLQLSEKEQIDRAKVVLPFEHQGNGKPIEIYDGRGSLTEQKHEATLASAGNAQRNEHPGEGEIIYFRDSDDERPDSDEDPDDDLDI